MYLFIIFFLLLPQKIFEIMIRTFYAIAVFGVLNVMPFIALSQTKQDTLTVLEGQLAKLISDSRVSAQLFLGFQYHHAKDFDYSEFALKRGYITFQKQITPFLSGRITPDITIDREGDGEGDVEMRLKYCFAELKDHSKQGLITEPAIVIGQVFTPHIEFEEKINLYRVEGAHFMDRVKQVSSADFGMSVTALIGGKIDKDYQTRVNKNYPGKYGSIALGVYNGGGYHSIEKNANKTIQWRITYRPLPSNLPGFQATFSGAIGKGNTALSPDWNLYAGFLSYEQEFFTATAQYFNSKGDYRGKLADENGLAYTNSGYSLFFETKFFKKKTSLFGRWDYHKINDLRSTFSKRYILGIAYHIQGKTKIVMDYNLLDSNELSINPDLGLFEVMFELAF
jgi:hypothetical protein